jgi:hypothetical protein
MNAWKEKMAHLKLVLFRATCPMDKWVLKQEIDWMFQIQKEAHS